jgi:hypothetical protein
VKEEVSQTISLGEELKITSGEYLQYLYADIQYSFIGKIRRFLFQPPSVYVVLRYEDGTEQRYKAIVPIMKTGVLINKRTDSRYDAINFFMEGSVNNPNVTSIHFEAKNGIEESIQIKIKKMICL